MNQTKLLLIDQGADAGRALNGWLHGRGLSVVSVTRLDDAIEVLSDFTTGSCVDVVMLPVSMSDSSILNVQNTIRLSCEGQHVDVFTLLRSNDEAREQLEEIFRTPPPIPASASASSLHGAL